MQQYFLDENWFDWVLMYVKFFLIHSPDLFRTGYQNQAISSLEQVSFVKVQQHTPYQKSGKYSLGKGLGRGWVGVRKG